MSKQVKLLVTLEVTGVQDLRDTQNRALVKEYQREIGELSFSLGAAHIHVSDVSEVVMEGERV